MFKRFFIILLILICPAILSSQEYFRSNINGMSLEKIKSLSRSQSEYVLEVEKKGDVLYRTLYKNREIYKKWISQYNSSGDLSKETFFEGEDKTETFYILSSISEEKYYKGGELAEIIKYSYLPDGKISSVEKYDSTGKIISRREYSPDNSIRITTGDGKNNPEEKFLSKYSFSGTDIKSEWQGDSEDTGLFFSYDSGKILYSEKWTEGKLVSRTDYTYSGTDLAETSETFFSEDRVIIWKYDEKRHVTEETEKKGKSIVRTVYNSYTGDNISRKIVKSDAGTEKYLYNYTDDKLTGELYYLNGSLVKKTVYQEEEGNYYEDLYSENIKYMRIYYRDNEKYKTEQ